MDKDTTDSGTKSRQIKDREDRSLIFKDWHRELSKEYVALDIDLVEWRLINGKYQAVGVLELTRADHPFINQDYLDKIVWRFTNRDDYQRACCMKIAKALGCQAYIVLFKKDLSEFCIYYFNKPDKPWLRLSQDKMEQWINALPYINGNLPWPEGMPRR